MARKGRRGTVEGSCSGSGALAARLWDGIGGDEGLAGRNGGVDGGI